MSRNTIRRASIIGAVTLLGTATVLAGIALTGRPRAAPPSPPPAGGTAPVTRGTVTERTSLSGTLGFDGSYRITHLGPPGVLTSVPEPGATIARGETLYAVANEPVMLLYGTLPAYRDFAPGMGDGPDVRLLEQNLRDLGLNPGPVDARFTAATADAIRRWQASWGLPAAQRTGTLAQGRVVFLPDALRVSEIGAPAGSALAPNTPVLMATSTRRVVTAQLTADRQHTVKTGDTVQVSVNGLAPFPGTLTRIGKVATVAPDQQGRAPLATVPVTIAVTLPAGSPELDQAPVQVAIATRTHTGVLMVPVAALLARPGGGYHVKLVMGGYVEVRPGLFDDITGTVEVAGALTENSLVEVPAP
jgi:peptidoglycan hydrolase-like protein with peptidoglycan-binding domain